MSLSGADPASALRQINQELKEKFDEAGMQKVEEFTDDLDDILEKAKAGPGKLLAAAEQSFKEFQENLKKTLEDPAALAPAGGMAACASWYGSSVAGKLNGLSEETAELAQSITKMTADIAGPFKQVGETLDSAMGKLEKSVKALAKLPKLVSTEIDGKDSPDDIAKINCAPMKAALSGGDVDGPLKEIMGLKEILGTVVACAERGVNTLQAFIDNAPAMITGAFDVPMPLCFLTSMVLSQAPKAMQDLLAMVDKLKAIDLQPLVRMCSGMTKSIGCLSVDMVQEPIAKFTESAGGLVDKLESTVKGAKLASNPAGAMGGKMGGMFGA